MTRKGFKREPVISAAGTEMMEVTLSSPTMKSGRNVPGSSDADIFMSDASLVSANGLPTPNSAVNGTAVDEMFIRQRETFVTGK
jgi:hypothetical protein